jgi:hypothetical protein
LHCTESFHGDPASAGMDAYASVPGNNPVRTELR